MCVVGVDDHQYNTLNFHNNDTKSSSNHRPATNYLEITSNYVEPNSRDGGVVRFFPFKPHRSKSKKTKNKPVITSRPDGSGIVQVGTLQAIIPSNNTVTTSTDDQKRLKIVPSVTHESYVDVVK